MDFELQPFLEGVLVQLRPLRSDDFAATHAAASDPLVWEQHPEHDRYRVEVFRGFFEAAIASGGALAIIDRESGSIIGSSRYYGHDPAKREVMIGYTFLERKFWGKAFNREVKSLMIAHALRFTDRVLFQVGESNVRSQRAMQNIGAQVVDRMELPARDGTMVPHLLFAITRVPEALPASTPGK